jgi:hypothetical protein
VELPRKRHLIRPEPKGVTPLDRLADAFERSAWGTSRPRNMGEAAKRLTGDKNAGKKAAGL